MIYAISNTYYKTLREVLGNRAGKKVIYATKPEIIAYLNQSFGILGGIENISIEKDGQE